MICAEAARIDFNPRTPCGVRQRREHCHSHAGSISIHAPLAGCDRRGDNLCLACGNFNPRTPCGVRLVYETNTL